jgi:hypothetical protein
MLSQKRFEVMKKAFLAVNSISEEQFTVLMSNMMFRGEFQSFRLGWETCTQHYINDGVLSLSS